MRTSPPQGVLEAFSTVGDPHLLDGGQGETWRVGAVVLKPAGLNTSGPRFPVDFLSMGEAGDLLVYRQPQSFGAARDLEIGVALLQGTRAFARNPEDPSGTPPMLRIYRPQPTVAFGQRDARLPGYEAAARAARRLGYEPLIRRAGGRAAAYHPGCLVVDHIEPDSDPIRESQARFAAFGELLGEALMRCGVDAQLGPVPHEYCYGEHSVHGVANGQPDERIKLIGTAQRQIATGWLFSSSIIVEGGPSIRRVLTETYDAMGLEWDPLSAGAASDLAPGLTVERVEAAVLEVYAQHWTLREGTPAAL